MAETVYAMKEIKRLPIASSKKQLLEYISNQQPVIFQKAYVESPIDKIRSISALNNVAGEVDIKVAENYYDSTIQKVDPISTTVREYYKFVNDNPSTLKHCRVREMPDCLRKMIQIPESVKQVDREPEEFNVFMGKLGVFAPMHFDGDHKEVFFTQVIGKKRIHLIEPKYSARLCPISNFSSLAIHRYSADDREALLEYLHAFECILNPGETLYIPRLWWHMLESLGHTVSFNLRFGRTTSGRILSLLPMDYKLQGIASKIIDGGTSALRQKPAFQEILLSYFGNAKSPTHRYQRYQKVLEKIYTPWFSVPPQMGEFDLSRRMSQERFENIKADGHHSTYFAPDSVSQTKLSEAITPQQSNKIQHAIQSGEKTETQIRQVLKSFGFPEQVESLTGLQACLFLNFLKS